ncbi:DUF397 domain-containing protein [Streptomyces pathocidini]|uniref:DUF397 domain-containing protein n=1 Tax=Streptomyces pathocidini TaxID=1650571 RepID=A0ABW7UN12_9ACTN|nr:DUF397 domain-containing protein [Streptomyces pathocidini]
MSQLRWRKSSFSTAEGDNCVEVASLAQAVAVRDSKDPEGPFLTFSSDAFASFVSAAVSGGFGEAR